MPAIRSTAVVRYITPLREGGSLPAIVAAEDGFSYMLKFRGAGQGIRALIAELIGGEVARAIGLRVPEIVFATVDPAFGRTEPDKEIQDLLQASAGLNLGLHYLQGAITYDPAAGIMPDALLALEYRAARCLTHKCGSHRTQHESTDVALGALADRPWRGTILSSQLE